MKEFKIVAMSCSPSKGRNSDSMLDSFIEGVERVEGVVVHKIYLSDVPIDYYTHENRTGPAKHEQEFRNLTDEIRSSDGLVIATPTYNFSVPAHLKNFVDRVRFFALDFSRTTKLGQPVGLLGNVNPFFLVSGGTPNWARRILFFAFPLFWLRGVFIYYGANYMGGIYSGDTKTYINKKVLARCTRAGTKFARRISEGHCGSMSRFLFWRPPQER